MSKFKQMLRVNHMAIKPVMMLALICAVALASVWALSVSTNAVSIYDGDKISTVYTFSSNADDILDKAGVELDGKDEYVFSGISDGCGEIKLKRAFGVTVKAGGKTYRIDTTGGTVADALSAAGVTAGESDVISHPLDQKLSEGMTVTLTRVEYKTEIKKVEIPYGTDVVYSASLAEGKTTTSVGTPGVMAITYTYKYADGKLVDTVVSDEAVELQPKNAVKTVGTKKAAVQTSATASKPSTDGSAAASQSAGANTALGTYTSSGIKYVSGLTPAVDFELDENGIPVNYSKVIRGKASAYSGGGLTATGKSVRTGYVAVNPRQIPYGTRLFVRCLDGSYIYGYAVAQDTGSFIRTTDRIIDLYFPTESQCERFGVRYVDIYVLD